MGRPGKFEGSGKIGERLYELVQDGGADQEYGSSSEPPHRWWGLVTKTGIRGAANAIVTEDSQGFFDYEAFPTALKARRHFEKIVREVVEEMGPQEGDEYWVTEDHVRFYEQPRGKLVATVREGEEAWEVLEREMERQGFYPEVWFLSDHGNYHLMEHPPRRIRRKYGRKRSGASLKRSSGDRYVVWFWPVVGPNRGMGWRPVSGLGLLPLAEARREVRNRAEAGIHARAVGEGINYVVGPSPKGAIDYVHPRRDKFEKYGRATTKKNRLYHVVAIDETKGRKYYLTVKPESHDDAVRILSKQSPSRQGVRKQLEETSSSKPSPSRAVALNYKIGKKR